ncbi:MAG: TIGR03960 family B12-binding radical SAM protein [Candidatus Auribacterota bacterium]|jgi:radical SAM family uncharacterized protein/radical SAM-linked protein|nr:TIGR03960 family B12-binding radical SAM protein [Candidatus Auribacterota bacterium]
MINNKNKRYERLLSQIQKPSRYIGHEWNSIVKKASDDAVHIVLAFPDMYEIGMSHLGIRILYTLLNKDPSIVAQRVYAPARDYVEALKASSLPLCTLETQTPLGKMDIVGFSFQYELGYTNVLNMLDASNIPLRSADRNEADPIVIAGGPCVYNPEPMALFIDAFLIGDGETAAVQVCHCVREGRLNRLSRKEILQSLACISGVYVPSLYETQTEVETGLVVVKPDSGSAPYPVVRRIEFDLNQTIYPDSFPVPFCEMVHDRINVEISRGCNAGCRFCQAGVIYRPNRSRRPDDIVKTICDNLRNTGLDEVSLTSLDVSSYPCLEGLVGHLMQIFREKTIALSLPSMRTGAVSEHIAEQIQSVRKTGFTLAPEAGSQRLRDVINKNVSMEEITSAARFAFSQGWQLLKLYFMIGLPTETDSDIADIVALADSLSRIGHSISARGGNINVSVSTFVPKPHTPFQWHAMERRDSVFEKQQRLLDMIRRKRKIKLKWHDADASFLEAVISRGDRRIGEVIEEAYRRGALFDAWTDEFDISIWQKAFEVCGLDPEKYVYRPYRPGVLLPWSHIDTGVRESYLISELEKSMRGELTSPCGQQQCHQCGVCIPEYFSSKQGSLSAVKVPENPVTADGKVYSYHGFFRKNGIYKFLSHREVINTLIRSFRREGIRINHSCGFNPHPKFSFGPALSTGMAGLREPIRFELVENIPPAELQQRISRQLPEDLAIFDIAFVTDRIEKMEAECAYAVYKMPHNLSQEKIDLMGERVLQVMADSSLTYTRTLNTGKRKSVDLRPFILAMKVDESSVKMALHNTARAQDVILAVFGDDVDCGDLVRICFFMEGEKQDAIDYVAR